MENNTKKVWSKKIISTIICILIIIILFIVILINKINPTADKLLNKISKNKTISLNIITTTNKNQGYYNPLEKENINFSRMAFYDKRITDYEENYCSIWVFDNEQYAALVKLYFEQVYELDKKIAQKYNFNYDLISGKIYIYNNKNALIILDDELDDNDRNEYREEFNKIVNNNIYINLNSIDESEYKRLEEDIYKQIEEFEDIHEKEWLTYFENIISTMNEYLEEQLLLLDEDGIEEAKILIQTYGLEDIEYFNDAVEEWNKKISEIEEKIEQKKQDNVKSINEKIQGAYNSLSTDDVQIIKEEINKLTDTYYDEYKNIWNDKIADIENKIKENSIAIYKSNCKSYTYTEISRSPETYRGNQVYFCGKVVQIIEGTYSTDLRVNVTKGNYGIYTDTIYVTYYNPDSNNRILENDIIKIYGTLDGLQSYTTVLGSNVTIPKVSAKYIDVQ